MSLRFLLDSNVISEPTRKRPNARVLEKLQRFQASVAVSSTVWDELWFGAHRLEVPEKKDLVIKYMRSLDGSLEILPFSKEAAEWHAEERARLEALGTRAPYADGLVAAVAAVSDLVLVTDNLKHFRRFKGLRIDTWSR